MKPMHRPSPRRPANLPEYGEACLVALANHGLGEKISVGGALGLLHYLDYRPTNDVDAWWTSATTLDDQRRVVELIEATLSSAGPVRTRSWGEVVSVELSLQGRTRFSFKIARRSAQLAPSAPAPWTAVLLDSLPDLVAGKMVALIERGAPRDFRDIYALCQAGLVSPRDCWRFWAQRQQLASSDSDVNRARLAITTHLSRIAQHRPVDEISEPDLREQAATLRGWFAGPFLDTAGQDDA